jgi:hypothetical protein
MKTDFNSYFLMIAFFMGILSHNGQAQNSFPSSGNVGIGTLSPSQKLHVIGTIGANANMVSNPNSSAWAIYGWSNDVARIRIGGSGEGSYNGLDIQTINNKSLMRLLHNGNIGIGTTNPTHKLEVNGTVRAKEVKLEATNWPDYVFAEDYKLPVLEETESYIKTYGHLPGFKSAEVYEAEGVNVLELNQKLLEKVEEMMLYTIRQQQLIEEQQKAHKQQSELIEKQQYQLGKLKDKIERLENRIGTLCGR